MRNATKSLALIGVLRGAGAGGVLRGAGVL